MAIIPFTVFLDKVEDGRKCRTYRMAKCVHEKGGHCGILYQFDKEESILNKYTSPACYLHCSDYEYRIKKGDTIHAYTGLRQRKYCTNAGARAWREPVVKGHYCEVMEAGCCNCHYRGAKLLRPDLPRCIDTYPIKLKNIAEEDARLDGFESIGKGTNGLTKEFANSLEKAFRVRPLEQLKQFLIKNYNAKPDTPIQAIIWEGLKGRNAGK